MGFTGGEIAFFEPLLCVNDLVYGEYLHISFIKSVNLSHYSFNDSAVRVIKNPASARFGK